jgi:hypothetical protein
VGASWAGAPSQRRRHTVPTAAAISANKPDRRQNVSLLIFLKAFIKYAESSHNQLGTYLQQLTGFFCLFQNLS